MKKKLAKIIGSILLSSMVLVSVCPLSALASEEPVTETGEVTIVAEALTEEQTESIAVAESEPIVTGGQTLAEITATDPDVQIVENTDPEDEEKAEKENNQKQEEQAVEEAVPEEVKQDASEELQDTDPGKETKEVKASSPVLMAAAETKSETRIDLNITNNTGMFNAVTAYVETKDGKTVLVMALNGTGYHYLFLGTYEEASAVGYDPSAWIEGITDENGKLAFRIPLEDGRTFYPLVAISQTYLENYLKDRNTLERSFFPRQAVVDMDAKTLVTGDYEFSQTLTVEKGEDVPEITEASLETVGGPNSNNYKADLSILFESDLFDKAFVGTAEAAAKATKTIEVKEKTLLIPVRWVKTFGKPETMETLLDEPFITALHSILDDTWYEWKFDVDEEKSILTIGEPTEEDKEREEEKADDESDPSPDDGKQDDQSQEEDPLNGGTAAVDNSTSLPDGTYTPDSFSFSGGTGRVNITCPQVTITNGQAYATIVFGSSKYGYVKASGGTYYPTVTNGTSVFSIPVELNKNNTIIGMTTAMSAAHEITYSIFVYIAAAEGKETADSVNNNTIGEENRFDETAPSIMGLSGGEEIPLEHAEYLKLFRYDDGITLIEIDRTTGTVLDPEQLSKDTAKETKDDSDSDQQSTIGINDEEGTQADIKTDADYRMDLYQADVVKYLVVPEDVEIPAGLDKKAIIIRLPKESVYVSSENAAAMMENLGLLDRIKTTGVTEETCTNEALKTALKEEKIISVGTIDALDYTELIKAKTDFVIGTEEELLPKEAAKDKKAADYQEQYTKVSERMALLDVPLLIVRAADEKDPLGSLEWLKLIGILFDKEAEADALIKKGVQ